MDDNELIINLDSEIRSLLLKSEKKHCNFDTALCLHNDDWLTNSEVKKDEISFENLLDLEFDEILNSIEDWISRYKFCNLIDTQINYKQSDKSVHDLNSLLICISFIECRRKVPVLDFNINI